MVNAAGGDAWADEDTVYAPEQESLASRAIAAALAMEDAVQRSELDWLILRGGLFYGPGTGFDDDWFARARAGRLRLPGDGARLRLAASTSPTWPTRRSRRSSAGRRGGR